MPERRDRAQTIPEGTLCPGCHTRLLEGELMIDDAYLRWWHAECWVMRDEELRKFD